MYQSKRLTNSLQNQLIKKERQSIRSKLKNSKNKNIQHKYFYTGSLFLRAISNYHFTPMVFTNHTKSCTKNNYV